MARQSQGPQVVSRRVTTRRRTPISGEMGGTQDETVTTMERPATSQRRSAGPVRQYGPTSAGEKVGTIGTLEAEFVGSIILIFLTVFTDATSSYGDKMLAIMKRGTLAAILFFILALLSTAGEGSAKFAKAFGLLVMAGIFLSTAGQDTISVLDTFFKANWTSGGTTADPDSSSANAEAGQQTGIGKAENVATIPGVPPTAAVPGDIAIGAENVLNWIKSHANVGQAAKSALQSLIP